MELLGIVFILLLIKLMIDISKHRRKDETNNKGRSKP